MAFTTVTVTGTYKRSDGTTAASGTVSFVASHAMTDSSNNQVVAPTRVTGTLNSSGVFSVTLTATDDTTTTPSGVTYEVTERIIDAAENKYNISVPKNSPSVGGTPTLDLADVTPVHTPVTSYAYATTAYVDSKIGVTAPNIPFNATSEISATNVQAAIEEVRSKSKYTHDQQSPATTWSITHNLGFRPNVSVVDTSENQCLGDITYTSDNALTVTFLQSFGGKAYLS